MGADMYRMIGVQIRAARQQRRMRVRDLAEELGVTHSLVSLYERGDRKIPLERLEEACSVLNLDTGDVIVWARRMGGEG